MVLLFLAALLAIRIMGNRTVAQLSPFDFVIMVGVGDVIVTAAMEREQNLLGGFAVLLALVVLQQILSWLALKNLTLRKWFEGTPVTLVENGRLIKENFVKTQFNMDDLRQELHKQGLDFTNLQDIRLARLESCGDFSLIKMPDLQPLSRRDFDQYIRGMFDNPLSIAGSKWVKIEQMMDDIHLLAEEVRRRQSGQPSETAAPAAGEMPPPVH